MHVLHNLFTSQVLPFLHSLLIFQIIDTGASNHIYPSLSSLFGSYRCTSLSFVQLSDSSKANVTHTGTVSFSNSLYIHNVFYIPSFKSNLLSVTQLTNSLNCIVIFPNNYCVFGNFAMNRTIGLGKVHDGLYFLQPSNALLVASFLHLISGIGGWGTSHSQE